MDCRYCGHELMEEALFCSKCGKAVDDREEPEKVEPISLQKIEQQEKTETSPGEIDLAGAFVGKNYKYYKHKWEKIEGKNNKTSWNWAAFFLGPIWFGYRKMYFPIIYIVVAYLAIDFLLYLSNYQYTEATYYWDPIDQVLTLPIAMLIGFYANQYYLKHTEKYIKKADLFPYNDKQKKLWLNMKGGRSWLGVLLAAFIFLVYGITSTILFPTNMDKIYDVQDTILPNYPSKPIGEYFENYFDDPKWELLNSRKDNEKVQFTGIAYKNGTPVKVTIDFYLTNDSFEVNSATVGNEKWDLSQIYPLFDAIFYEEDFTNLFE